MSVIQEQPTVMKTPRVKIRKDLFFVLVTTDFWEVVQAVKVNVRRYLYVNSQNDVYCLNQLGYLK